MKEISDGQLQLSDYNFSALVTNSTSPPSPSSLSTTSSSSSAGLHRSSSPSFFQQAHDILYYRTKWPWPLKDRDYTLARRCKVFPAQDAVVYISKSIEVENTRSFDEFCD